MSGKKSRNPTAGYDISFSHKIYFIHHINISINLSPAQLAFLEHEMREIMNSPGRDMEAPGTVDTASPPGEEVMVGV